MSQEKVEIVRRGYEAYNAGDPVTLYEQWDPDIVMFHLEGWPEPRPRSRGALGLASNRT